MVRTGGLACVLIFMWVLPSYAAITSNDIAQSEPMGDVLWIESGQSKQLALVTKGQAPLKGTLILLHDIGAHADWPDLIHPIRTELPIHGWTVVSLNIDTQTIDQQKGQAEALAVQLAEAIRESIAAIGERHGPQTVLATHGKTAHLMLKHLSQQQGLTLNGFIAMGIHPHPAFIENNRPDVTLDALEASTLDIYGQLDTASLLFTAVREKNKASPFTSIEIAGADHFFTHQSDSLIKRLRGWLKRLEQLSYDEESDEESTSQQPGEDSSL